MSGLLHYAGPLVPRPLDTLPACGEWVEEDRVFNRPDLTTCPRCRALLTEAGVAPPQPRGDRMEILARYTVVEDWDNGFALQHDDGNKVFQDKADPTLADLARLAFADHLAREGH